MVVAASQQTASDIQFFLGIDSQTIGGYPKIATIISADISRLAHLRTGDQIEFKNLSFRFPGQSRVLESINIKLSKGELVAITGESGSGKTTLASLLQKFYTAEIGGIIINETRNLNAIDTHVWREKIGVVEKRKIRTGT